MIPASQQELHTGSGLERRSGTTRLTLVRWVLAATCAWSVGYWWNYMALDSDLGWTYSVYRQKLAIAEQFRDRDRVLIVGGSSTHYSVDAAQMEQILGRPVINLGLHAGLGLNAILAGVEPEIQRGDLVVLIPEYGTISDDGVGWLAAAFGAAIGRPGIGGVGSKQTVREVLRAGIVTLPSFGRSVVRVVFNARGRAVDTIGERGDVVHFLQGTAVPLVARYSVSDHAFRRLQRFRQHVDGAGANLVFALPWLLVSDADKESSVNVKKIVSRLQAIAPVVYGPDLELKTDVSLFSDTYYHPNQKGRHVRSSDLSAELQSFLAPKRSGTVN